MVKKQNWVVSIYILNVHIVHEQKRFSYLYALSIFTITCCVFILKLPVRVLY